MGIKVNNLSYQDKLKDITYEFEESKITGIMTSCGSYFGYVLSGILSNYDGEIESSYIGRDISYVFENPDVSFIFDTVYEELVFGLNKYNYKKDEERKRAEDALKMVGLPREYLDRNPYSLSSGEKKLLSIATSLILNPKVIILDNPTLGLDNEREEFIIKLFKKLKSRYHKTIIIISSDINFMLKIIDNYVILRKGKITSMGKKKELLINTDKLKSANLEVPLIIEFINMVKKKKNITLEYTFDIKELMKDIYRNV